MRNYVGVVRLANISRLRSALRLIVIAISSSFLISITSVAEETEMDMDLMQNIEDTNDSLSSNIALGEADAAIADAKMLNELFIVVEKHFAAQADSAEAVDLSKKSIKFSSEIVTFIEQNDFDSAANAATDLSRACKTCHNFYKED
ncbi:MAG: hypothetical protein AAGC78_04440 [Cellvibrio sp.]|uniref:hypothetical protein n=1 Tax=Cellvibrio sp. TaxID=1965322 RepID=UPI0031A6C2DA